MKHSKTNLSVKKNHIDFLKLLRFKRGIYYYAEVAVFR